MPTVNERRYWWVNHKQTYKQEVGGSYLWSPKTKANGAYSHSYNNMSLVQAGDMVFSFAGAAIRAIGIALGPAESSPKPDEFGKVGDYWSNEGWRLPVQFDEIRHPLRTQDHAAVLAPFLPAKYSPIRADGKGNQGIYLAALSTELAILLKELLEGQVEVAETNIDWSTDGEEAANAEERRTKERTDIGPTEKQQLVKARRGQGLFRDRLALVEQKGCRITGVLNKQFLRASHIKPWAKSSDREKLDGDNGLWLAPHVDLLFDRGWISFADDGDMLVSSRLHPNVLHNWAIDSSRNYGAFRKEQKAYLSYHRAEVFKK